MIAVTYGYARVSKADDEAKNLETQLRVLADHGIRPDLVYSDVASGRNLQRPGWQDLMSRIQSGDTLVVAFLDRLSRSFEDGVRIQVDLTQRTTSETGIPLSWESSSKRRRCSEISRTSNRFVIIQYLYGIQGTAPIILTPSFPVNGPRIGEGHWSVNAYIPQGISWPRVSPVGHLRGPCA